MKSPVFNDKKEMDKWLGEQMAFGKCEPTHFPCIVILDRKSICEIVYYSEFQGARYIVDNKELMA